MKLYVLDEPFAPGAGAAAAEAPGPRRRRALWLRLGLAALAIGASAAYLAGVVPLGIGEAASTAIRTGTVAAPPAAAERAPALAAPVPDSSAAAADPEPVSAPPVEASSVVRRNGKFFIELHGVEPGAALAMLSKATGVTVLGGDALLQHAAPVTASVIAPSPVAAWQSVFGDVANFAMSCAGAKACVVHFVAAARPGSTAPTIAPAAPAAEPSVAPAAAPSPGTTVYPEEN